MKKSNVDIPCFLELKEYPIDDFKKIFGDNFEKVIFSLSKRSIYKETNGKFTLEYVGILCFNDIIISILPKFFNSDMLKKSLKIKNIKLTVDVLKKYNNLSLEESLDTFDTTNKSNLNNKLALVDFLFKDYMEYGIYENHIDTYEINGEGEISWENTIENECAYLIKDRPIYLDLWTSNTVSNEEDYIRKLHQYILDKCVEYASNLEIQKIIEIIDIPNINFFSTEDGLGDIDFMLRMIENEIKIEFNDRKINLLKKMERFLTDINSESEEKINLWGVRKFWSIWESICGDLFNNQYSNYNNLIPKPIWVSYNPKKENKINHTLIPDVLIKVDNDFFIFDAKYYDFSFDDKGQIIGKQPGIADVTKQFAYEMAFKEKFGENVYNFFVIPTSKATKVIGEAKLSIFEDLKPIKILQLSHQEAFNMYLKNEKYSNDFFKHLI